MAYWSGVATVDVDGDVPCADESFDTTWAHVCNAECYCVDVAYASVWFENLYVADAVYSE